MQVREETKDSGEGEVGDEKQRVEDQKKRPRPKLGTYLQSAVARAPHTLSPGLLVEK